MGLGSFPGSFLHGVVSVTGKHSRLWVLQNEFESHTTHGLLERQPKANRRTWMSKGIHVFNLTDSVSGNTLGFGPKDYRFDPCSVNGVGRCLLLDIEVVLKMSMTIWLPGKTGFYLIL